MTTGPAIVSLGPRSAALALRLRALLPSSEIHSPACADCAADVRFAKATIHIAELFAAGRPIVGLCASGILIRAVGPILGDKTAEPPVVAVAEDGSAVVPLLGGHHGANALARTIAAELGVASAVTTAGDNRFGIALDAPPPGWTLANPEHAKGVMARLLEGSAVRLTVDSGDPAWLTGADLPVNAQAATELLVTHRAVEGSPDRLVYHPPVLALGVGAEAGAPPEALSKLVDVALTEHGLARASVACIVSLDLKAAEPAVHALAAKLGVPARFFPAERLLAETPRLATPSEIVFRETGCWGWPKVPPWRRSARKAASWYPSARASGSPAPSPWRRTTCCRHPSAAPRAGSPSSASGLATCAGARARRSSCWPRPRSWSATASIST